MSATNVRPLFQFDRGLEEIYHSSDAEISLPSSVSFGPAQIAFIDQIQAQLSPPDIQDFLRLSMLPDVDPHVLAPHVFHDTLEQAAEALRNHANAPGVANALDVIAEDLSLRDLLSFYRNALIAG